MGVHLEIAHSLDTDSCLMAVRRMMARQGRPANIWSDNGTLLGLLLTFTAEVESLMNGHPLTHVSTDHRDEKALTPNHFLLRQGNPNFLPDVVNDKNLCSQKRWQHTQVMTSTSGNVDSTNIFLKWKKLLMFVKEILHLSLTRTHLVGVGR